MAYKYSWFPNGIKTPSIVDNSGNVVMGGQQSAVTDLTDNSGGTASGTLAAITAGASYAQADMVAVKNAIASLAAQCAALNAALAGYGVTS